MAYATITLQLKTRSARQAALIAESAAVHLLDTFNDGGSIREAWHREGELASECQALRAALAEATKRLDHYAARDPDLQG